ncbi:hypothetical protein [Parasitella parasitica]|uniref:Uncharacterized protein n=1 Tax=Parasitella parasitica TaxID=35722 RepID=A0A0B7NQZ7_9FUNG|nr:hypothetical protein [Parasitella parasitica]
MEFREVNSYIDQDSDDNKQQSFFSKIKKRLRRKSSWEKARDIYLKTKEEMSQFPVMECDPRIVDCYRYHPNMIPIEPIPPQSDENSEVVNLAVLSKEEEEKPDRKVNSDENADQNQPNNHGRDPTECQDPTLDDRFM